MRATFKPACLVVSQLDCPRLSASQRACYIYTSLLGYLSTCLSSSQRQPECLPRLYQSAWLSHKMPLYIYTSLLGYLSTCLSSSQRQPECLLRLYQSAWLSLNLSHHPPACVLHLYQSALFSHIMPLFISSSASMSAACIPVCLRLRVSLPVCRHHFFLSVLAKIHSI
jgi:hypothetical protein